ncbi:hypothetical protein QBZ16_002926 [Prototheca wickerhamii]|uniref:Ysc84 actin-binding domain-containing protein n=1 Tax=Prototheca wickerhamii TaxID=3111 RepID=A0AAD9IMB0_PROWI|nr:hypothetical protein QBZ16_002926 [Prototheca wickerhamii]
MSKEDRHAAFQAACGEALRILRRVADRGEDENELPPLEDTRSPLKPFWVEQSDSLLIYNAPLFVTVSGGGGGLTFGHTTTSSFTVCMTPALRTQLEGKGKAPFGGLDASLIVGPRLIESAEFGTASYATVGARVEGGLLFNLSYTAGTIALDKSKNARLYGAEVSAADVLEGRVPEPAELQPLYGDLAGIVHSVERPSAPSLVRSSLDRATLGEDPDRHGVVLDDGTVYH